MRRSAFAAQFVFLCVFVGAWELVARLGWTDKDVLPAFSLVAAELAKLVQDADFMNQLGITAVRVAIAFMIGAPAAISLGFLLGEKLHLGRVLNPVIHFVLAVPQSVFLPIFIQAFGIGFLQKIVFGVTHVFFVVVVNTVAAVQAVPKPLVLAARSFGATPTQIYWKIYLPAMLPLVVTGLRLGMVFNIIGVLLAEMYGSRQGVGLRIFEWGESLQVAKMMAAVVIVSVGTILVNELMRLWEARVGRWQAALLAAA